MGRSSKAAGSRFERWLTDTFARHGWISARLRSFQVEGEPDLYATKKGIVLDVQAKERQNLNVHKVLRDLIEAQAVIAAKQGTHPWAVPAVVYKHVEKRGDSGRRTQVGPVMIALPLDDFLQIVEGS